MYPDSKKAPANLEHHLLLVLWGHAGLWVAARVHQPVHVQVRGQGSGNQVGGGGVWRQLPSKYHIRMYFIIELNTMET